MSEPIAPAPPSIVLLDAGAPAPVLRQLCAGAEEEGVPIEISSRTDPDGDLVRLAHTAAQHSRLRVGVAADRSGAVVVHHATLPPEGPVHELTSTPSPVDVRRAGRLAARLCTRMPLT